jgi:hypothetical protein
MKKTLYVDDELLEQARSACGSSTDTDTVRQGLEALVRNAAYQDLAPCLVLSLRLQTFRETVARRDYGIFMICRRPRLFARTGATSVTKRAALHFSQYG